MNENEKEILFQFETKLQTLISEYNRLKELNSALSVQLVGKEKALMELQQRYDELEQTYTNLKEARMISLSYEEVDSAKEHITRLVREIDQCIDSLIKKQ